MAERAEYGILAYTLIGLGLEDHTGWGTLLFTSSRACNLSCDGCWTSTTNELIRKQLKQGAEWLYDGSYDVNVLDSILKKFDAEGGKLVACMSDGEPFVPANYDFMLEMAQSSGRHDLPLLLFTNGLYLTEEKLGEIEEATKGKISYCVSIQTGDRENYGNFMLADKDNGRGGKLYDKLREKFGAWREFDKRVQERTGKHGIAIHTYIIPEKTREEDLEGVRRIVEELGNVHWVVSTMGAHVSESLKGKVVNSSSEIADLVRRFNTGPTATLSFGEGENQKLCSYISHGFFPFEQEQGVFGITFNPYQKGQVQTCPYHSMVGTSEWLALRDYLDTLKAEGSTVTDERVGDWLENAVQAETLITKGAFRKAGYEHCLMRHSRKPEVDLFISEVNIEMAKRRREGRWDLIDNNYFDVVLGNLEEVVEGLLLAK